MTRQQRKRLSVLWRYYRSLRGNDQGGVLRGTPFGEGLSRLPIVRRLARRLGMECGPEVVCVAYVLAHLSYATFESHSFIVALTRQGLTSPQLETLLSQAPLQATWADHAVWAEALVRVASGLGSTPINIGWLGFDLLSFDQARGHWIKAHARWVE